MLELKNISHSFTDRLKNNHICVFHDINFFINEGDFVSLVGSSGCGKTTLVNIIAGYMRPTSGNVFVNGERVVAPGRDRIVINQEHDLFNWMTVYENMSLINSNEEEINNNLALTGLSDCISKYPYELSGGMKKRLSLARALLANPKFIIMDEPFSFLDFQLRENLQKSLLNIVKKTKKTVLFVTHDIEEAVFLSDKVIVLSGFPTTVKKEILVPNMLTDVGDKFIRDSNEFLNFKNMVKGEL